MFGLGCVAGAAGVARVHDYLARPPRRRRRPARRRALLPHRAARRPVDGEPRGLRALRRRRRGRRDGGGAARPAPSGSAGPHVVASRSRFYDDTERVMGWDVGVVRAAHRPGRLGRRRGAQQPRLRREGVPRRPRPRRLATSATGWPTRAGRRSSTPSCETLGLPDDALDADPATRWPRSATCPRPRCCTCSPTCSPRTQPGSGEPAVMLAMGPGFCSELVLLRW